MIELKEIHLFPTFELVIDFDHGRESAGKVSRFKVFIQAFLFNMNL